MDDEIKDQIEKEEANEFLNKKTVNINFRLAANLKYELQKRATMNNQTLSELMELISLNYFEDLSNDRKKVRNVELQQELSTAKKENSTLTNTNQELQTSIDFYEKNNKMLKYFDSHKNKTLKFKDVTGKEQEITVKSIKDIYSIVIINTKDQ